MWQRRSQSHCTGGMSLTQVQQAVETALTYSKGRIVLDLQSYGGTQIDQHMRWNTKWALDLHGAESIAALSHRGTRRQSIAANAAGARAPGVCSVQGDHRIIVGACTIVGHLDLVVGIGLPVDGVEAVFEASGGRELPFAQDTAGNTHFRISILVRMNKIEAGCARNSFGATHVHTRAMRPRPLATAIMTIMAVLPMLRPLESSSSSSLSELEAAEALLEGSMVEVTSTTEALEPDSETVLELTVSDSLLEEPSSEEEEEEEELVVVVSDSEDDVSCSEVCSEGDPGQQRGSDSASIGGLLTEVDSEDSLLPPSRPSSTPPSLLSVVGDSLLLFPVVGEASASSVVVGEALSSAALLLPPPLPLPLLLSSSSSLSPPMLICRRESLCGSIERRCTCPWVLLCTREPSSARRTTSVARRPCT